MSAKIQEIEEQITSLRVQLETLKKKSSSSMGVLKKNDWASVVLYEYDEDDKCVEIPGVPIILYHGDIGVISLNGCFDIESPYIKDIKKEFERFYPKAVIKKISPVDAIHFLNESFP